MNRYPLYKPSGIEWIGEIPSHWDCYRIKRLSNVKRGASPRPIDDPKYFDDNGEFSWVRIADVSASERYLDKTTQTLSELGASLSVKRYPGDFFLSIAGTVGKPIITKIKCCIHDGFVWFPNLKMNPEYLYYIFTTGLPYQGLGKWGTQLNLNTDTVGEIFIPIPDDNEIETLVNYLDEKTTQIDKLISNKQKLIELLKEERTAIINEAVSGKGKNWERKKLKYLLKPVKGALKPGPFGSDLKNSDVSIDGPIKVYTQRNVIDNNFEIGEDFISEEKFNLLSVFEIFENEILITTRGTIGKTAVFPKNALRGIIHPCLIKIQIDDNKVCNEWLTIYFNESSFFQENVKLNSNSTIIDVIYGYTLKEVLVPVPSFKEQTTIVKQIQTETQRIDNTIAKIKKEIELMQEYRTALISEVVTGKVKIK